jgi:hypothetical protein
MPTVAVPTTVVPVARAGVVITLAVPVFRVMVSAVPAALRSKSTVYVVSATALEAPESKVVIFTTVTTAVAATILTPPVAVAATPVTAVPPGINEALMFVGSILSLSVITMVSSVSTELATVPFATTIEDIVGTVASVEPELAPKVIGLEGEI